MIIQKWGQQYASAYSAIYENTADGIDCVSFPNLRSKDKEKLAMTVMCFTTVMGVKF